MVRQDLVRWRRLPDALVPNTTDYEHGEACDGSVSFPEGLGPVMLYGPGCDHKAAVPTPTPTPPAPLKDACFARLQFTLPDPRAYIRALRSSTRSECEQAALSDPLSTGFSMLHAGRDKGCWLYHAVTKLSNATANHDADFYQKIKPAPANCTAAAPPAPTGGMAVQSQFLRDAWPVGHKLVKGGANHGAGAGAHTSPGRRARVRRDTAVIGIAWPASSTDPTLENWTRSTRNPVRFAPGSPPCAFAGRVWKGTNASAPWNMVSACVVAQRLPATCGSKFHRYWAPPASVYTLLSLSTRARPAPRRRHRACSSRAACKDADVPARALYSWRGR